MKVRAAKGGATILNRPSGAPMSMQDKCHPARRWRKRLIATAFCYTKPHVFFPRNVISPLGAAAQGKPRAGKLAR